MSRNDAPRRRSTVVVYAGKGKRKGQRRAEEASSELVLGGGGGGGGGARSGSLAGALGPISIAQIPDGAETVEYFLLAKKRSDDEGEDASRWLPLGDVVFERGASVDDVVRERYWILRDFARKRHLALNIGNKNLRVGVRAQKGPPHPRANAPVDVVEVCDERDAPVWDPALAGDTGAYPAILRLLNSAPAVTAATKAQMLKQSAQFANSQDNAVAASDLRA